ncbi:MAG: kelch repeat-containing protein [Gemmatimonadales bacterium]
MATDTARLVVITRSSDGTGVPPQDVVWSSLTPHLVEVPSSDSGIVIGLHARGVAQVVATLANGAADTASVLVQPRPVLITIDAGGNQTTCVGRELDQPVVVRAVAEDQMGVAGVPMGLAPSDVGLVPTPGVVTNADGYAQTRWTLGGRVGVQVLEVRADIRTGPEVTVTAEARPTGAWTWVGGSSLPNGGGSRGALGVPAESNLPSARLWPGAAVGPDGSVWLFGGSQGLDDYSDLWELDGDSWVWRGGGDAANVPGTYGTKGVTSEHNAPGARQGATLWVDAQGTVWLFGGRGLEAQGAWGYLNDLWRFDGNHWTWVAGDSLRGSSGSYGQRGVAGASNAPWSRIVTLGWVDDANNLWLFGGFVPTSGYNVPLSYINDLWRFDGAAWAWMAGDSQPNSSGLSDVPGARSPIGALRRGESGWFFGGGGVDLGRGQNGRYADLWRIAGGTFTHVSGQTTMDLTARTGVMGRADPANTPGGRSGGSAWIDSRGVFWLFGGGVASGAALSDLWMFRDGEWTWLGGSVTERIAPVHGTMGAGTAATTPGSRTTNAAWVGPDGKLRMFGGFTHDPASGMSSYWNDMWRFDPACPI